MRRRETRETTQHDGECCSLFVMESQCCYWILRYGSASAKPSVAARGVSTSLVREPGTRELVDNPEAVKEIWWINSGAYSRGDNFVTEESPRGVWPECVGNCEHTLVGEEERP